MDLRSDALDFKDRLPHSLLDGAIVGLAVKELLAVGHGDNLGTFDQAGVDAQTGCGEGHASLEMRVGGVKDWPLYRAFLGVNLTL